MTVWPADPPERAHRAAYADAERWPFWVAGARDVSPALSGTVEADLCIVGGRIDCDFEPTGELTVLLEPYQDAWLEESGELLRRWGHDVELLDAVAMRAEVHSPTYRASIGWERRQGIGDGGNRFHYYRLTADGRILFGGYDAVYRFRGAGRTALGRARRDVRHALAALLHS
ncbi:hypothetical protein [Candidatus Solirubrobacter pratensis]|uniref:hypothetical protein n=1 Tax=Candidatus Solirubrobacter pratensis TaxID=1298857 RepID=UPI000422B654|nr:hypothetical protein [Candidatus Solirubrobacter pratensis]